MSSRVIWKRGDDAVPTVEVIGPALSKMVASVQAGMMSMQNADRELKRELARDRY